MSAHRSLDRNSTSTLGDHVRQFTKKTHQCETNVNILIRRLPTVLNKKQIKHLKEHKYASEGVTLFEPYLQKFWTWLVEFCPLWVAPNLITIVSLAINIVTSVLLMILTNGAKEQCTGWIYFLTAFGLFLYQTFDGIDGKQARRTNTSSPLGELFDHGCDSISAVFSTIPGCCALGLGHHPWLMFWCCMLSSIAFYCAHWQTYVSGKLRFRKLDCNESQIAIIVVHMISAISPWVWSKTIPLFNIECRVFIALVVLGSLIWSAANSIHTVSQGGCGRNYSSVAGTSIIFPAWPIVFLLFLAYIASNYSTSHALESHAVLYLTCYGIVFSKITHRLIVAHMSKSVLNAWDTGYIGPIAVCVNQYFNCFINEHVLLWLFLAYTLYDLLRYDLKVCQELCDALDIHCFRIKPSTTPTTDHSH